jgi:hypothetical protein
LLGFAKGRKIYLLFQNWDYDTWISTLSSSREAYTSLKDHLLRYIRNPDELESSGNPLDDENEVRRPRKFDLFLLMKII